MSSVRRLPTLRHNETIWDIRRADAARGVIARRRRGVLRPLARRGDGSPAIVFLFRARRERIEFAGRVLWARRKAIGVSGRLAHVDAIDRGLAPRIVRARHLFFAAIGSDPAVTSPGVGRPFDERNVAASAVIRGGVVARISRVVACRIRATAARRRAGLAARRWRRAAHEGAMAIGRGVAFGFRRADFGGRRATPDRRDEHAGDGEERRDDASNEGAHGGPLKQFGRHVWQSRNGESSPVSECAMAHDGTNNRIAPTRFPCAHASSERPFVSRMGAMMTRPIKP